VCLLSHHFQALDLVCLVGYCRECGGVVARVAPVGLKGVVGVVDVVSRRSRVLQGL
jgi:hypothetical protein